MTNLIDSYLIFRIRTKRDPEAFARIYDRYVEAIYRFAVLKLPNSDDAQDVAAETFTKAWQYLNERGTVSHIRALLYRIARNLIADFYRKNAQIQTEGVTVTSDAVSPSSSIEAERSDEGQGKRLIEARADLALVLQKMERLKEDYRDVLLLRLVDDLPFDVIAEILEKSVGNVRVIYHRALKAMKEIDGGEREGIS